MLCLWRDHRAKKALADLKGETVLLERLEAAVQMDDSLKQYQTYGQQLLLRNSKCAELVNISFLPLIIADMHYFFVCLLRNKDICTELSRPVNNCLLILYTQWQLTNVNTTIQLLFQRCICWQNDIGNIISFLYWKGLDYLFS